MNKVIKSAGGLGRARNNNNNNYNQYEQYRDRRPLTKEEVSIYICVLVWSMILFILFIVTLVTRPT